MKPGSKKLILMLFAAILMLTLIQLPFAPSASAAPTGTNYTFPNGKMIFTDTDGPGYTAGTIVGRNIVTAWYSQDINNLYFQVNLIGATWTNGDRVAIFIDYKAGVPGPGGNFSGFGVNTGAPAALVGMDYYIQLNHASGGWTGPVAKYWDIAPNPNNSAWNGVPNGTTANQALFPKWYASGDDSTSLQWKIPLGGLYNPTAIPFDFYVVTFPNDGWDKYLNTTSDVTPKFHTPIPSAAWLLGSGIIGLIGLKRRRARKA
jgi:hypothetical protein